MNSISAERLSYHAWLELLKPRIPNDALIYDIGKSDRHDYSEVFFGYRYLTLDSNEAKHPDIVCDVEHTSITKVADVVICNGVTEQCNNPYRLVDGTYRMLKPGGIALFGITSLAYPVYINDRVRFTNEGARLLLTAAGYHLDQCSNVIRNDSVSYLFFLCSKPRSSNVKS